jgi:hypothetical protein
VPTASPTAAPTNSPTAAPTATPTEEPEDDSRRRRRSSWWGNQNQQAADEELDSSATRDLTDADAQVNLESSLGAKTRQHLLDLSAALELADKDA